MHNIFTDNPDFYPTPKALIDEMLAEVDVEGKIVLEPSAGKGDIVDALIARGAAQVLACENDPNLKWTLQMEGHAGDPRFRFLKDDFLSVTREEVSHVDAIVMNPPFSEAQHHILHAWGIAPDGCTVVALCNADSFQHNGTQTWQKVREAVEAHGRSLTFVDAFATAERQTSVLVSLLTLRKEAASQDPFADYFLSDEDDAPAGGTQAGLMPYNFIRDIVQRYVEACRKFSEVDRLSKELNALAQYSEPAKDSQRHSYAPYLPVTFGARSKDGNGTNVTFDTYRKELQKYYWSVIFHKLDMEKYSTAKLREQLARFVEQTVDKPFTMRNIYAVLDIVLQTHGQRMREALVEAFEQICDFSADNSTAGEKWKTNSDYMVNRRFIVPWMCEGRSYSWDNPTVHLSYYGRNKLDDLNKALCSITGKRFEDIPDLYVFERDNAQWGQWYEWGFFRIRFYKKGTVHCEFLDEDVWMRFNAEVARIKGWALPKNTSKKRSKAA